MGAAFVEALPVKKFHGVGPATAAKMQRLGIETGADLKAKSLAFLQQNFGKSGQWYYRIARGADDRPVEPNRPRKSVGAEDTFASDIFELNAARIGLAPLIARVWHHCEANDIRARTVSLKVKFADFQQVTRSQTVGSPPESASAIEAICLSLVDQVFPLTKGIRLLGVTLSSLEGKSPRVVSQLPLGI